MSEGEREGSIMAEENVNVGPGSFDVIPLNGTAII